MIFSQKTGAYIVSMSLLASKEMLDINRICSDCDEEFREGEFTSAERHHGLIQLEKDGEKTWTLIIGCMGHHEIDWYGKVRNGG